MCMKQLTFVLAWSALLGCGDGLSTAEVSGRITFQGEPLVGAAITTQPIAIEGSDAGSGSFGETDEDGKYQLELVKPARRGAIVGEHRFLITPQGEAPPADTYEESEDVWSDNPAGNQQAPATRWPRNFQDGSLRLIVPVEGRSDANFDL